MVNWKLLYLGLIFLLAPINKESCFFLSNMSLYVYVSPLGWITQKTRFTRAWRSFMCLYWPMFWEDLSWWSLTPCSETLEGKVRLTIQQLNHICFTSLKMCSFLSIPLEGFIVFWQTTLFSSWKPIKVVIKSY